MLYTSPFEILNLPTAELLQMDRRALQLKKKQLMAELQLQSSGVITLGGKEFTKNDIVLLFEQLDDDNAIRMHAAIAADPVLLQFLQTGKINPGQKFSYNPLYQETEFIDFVSPFYKESFNRHILKALATSDYTQIDGIFGNPILLSGEDYDACFGKLRAYLEEKLHNIQVLKEQFAVSKRIDFSSLHQYYIYDWINTINKLPEEFANYRDDYAIDLYNLAVDLWNGKRRDEARAMLYGIQSIHASANTKQLISSLIDQISAVEESKSGKSGSSVGNVIWVIVALIVAAVRIGNSCNRNNSSKYDYSSILDQSRLYSDRYKMGFAPFQVVTKRDRAMMDLLNTLRQSNTSFTTKVPTSVPLTEGSNPFKAIFDKPIFKPETNSETSSEKSVKERPPHIVKDGEASDEQAIEDITVVEDTKLVEALAGYSFIDIKNNIDEETIVFFYSKLYVVSVYVKANSSYTVKLPNGNYHGFCYSGSQFSKNMPLKIPATAYEGSKKDFAGMGRFVEPNLRIQPYLMAQNNIHFIAGTTSTGYDFNATVTIDFGSSTHFNMQSGKGVLAVKTMVSSDNSKVVYPNSNY